MNITDIFQSGGNAVFVVTAKELKEFFHAMRDEAVADALAAQKEDVLLSESEVCEMLNVSHATLWRWGKSGILVPQKMGRRTYWRKSDIEKIGREDAK